VVIGCPKCKVKLKIADEKIKPEGLKIKCPKCSTVLNVRKPEPKPKDLNPKKIVVTHENPDVLDTIVGVMAAAGYMVSSAPDGVQALVLAMKELPFLVIADIATPKIHGFEIARRLKGRADTGGMKVVLVSSPTDESRQKKMPAAKYSVEAYIDDNQIEAKLRTLVELMLAVKKAPDAEEPEPAPEPAPAPEKEMDSEVEKAKRLSRLVLADIDLYNPEKVIDAIRSNSFGTVFAEDLKEGIKHYERRISPEVRNRGNFFQEAVDNFIETKRKSLDA
jgi:predicted Zn finger-like uncharacterized protein